MNDLIRIEYRDKNGDIYKDCSRSVVPRAGDFVQLNRIIYPIEEVIWIDDGFRVAVIIGKSTKRTPFSTTADYGNW